MQNESGFSNISKKELRLQNHFTFFREPDMHMIKQSLSFAQQSKQPIRIIAICCPWMEELPSVIPYSYEGTGTDILIPRVESKRIQLAKKRTTAVAQVLGEDGINVELALSVSNVQPQAHRVIIDQLDLITKTVDKNIDLNDYLLSVLPLVKIASSAEEIERCTFEHAQRIASEVGTIPVTIHNHLNLISQAIANERLESVTNKLAWVFKWMQQLPLDWDWTKSRETFLEALYLFDLVITPKVLTPQLPFVWVNMQPDNSEQTQIIGKVLQTLGPYPIIKGLHYEI